MIPMSMVLDSLPGLEDERAVREGIILVVLCRAARDRVFHAGPLAAGLAQGYFDLRRALTFISTGVLQCEGYGRGWIVVSDGCDVDRVRAQGRVHRSPHGHDDRLIVLVEVIVYRRDGDGPACLSGLDDQRAWRDGVIGPFLRCPAQGKGHGHVLAGDNGELHCYHSRPVVLLHFLSRRSEGHRGLGVVVDDRIGMDDLFAQDRVDGVRELQFDRPVAAVELVIDDPDVDVFGQLPGFEDERAVFEGIVGFVLCRAARDRVCHRYFPGAGRAQQDSYFGG